MAFIRGFGRFWYDFVIGDDWKVAAAIAVVLALGAVLATSGALAETWVVVLTAVGIGAAFMTSLVIDVRSQ